MHSNSFLKAQLSRLLAAAMLLCAAGTVNAAPFLPDNGDSYFGHGLVTTGVELGDAFGDDASTFGFYFKGDSGTLIPIFDSLDTVGDQAAINFQLGVVVDSETATVQNSFTQSLNDIGFFLNIGGAGGTNLFSDASLNPGGADVFLAQQDTINPLSWLMIFNAPINGVVGPASFNLITPLVSAVPVPAALWLFGTALIGLVGFGKRRKAA